MPFAAQSGSELRPKFAAPRKAKSVVNDSLSPSRRPCGKTGSASLTSASLSSRGDDLRCVRESGRPRCLLTEDPRRTGLGLRIDHLRDCKPKELADVAARGGESI